MYRVMIVDDEAIIRNGLATLIGKSKDFQVAALEEDGEMALENVETLKPDLILADINMPFMNGLEFIEKAKKLLPEVVVVIITGYDNFEYIQKAIRLGVDDYLLKPIVEDTFYDILEKMKNKLMEANLSRKYIAWAKNQMERNKPMLVENLFVRRISGYLDDEEFGERLQYLGVRIPEKYMLVLISLKENNVKTNSPGDAGWDDSLLYFACQNIVQETLGEETESICFRSSSGELVMITERMPLNKWERFKEEIIELVEQYLNVRMIVSFAYGIGNNSVPDVYDEAEAALRVQMKYSDTVLKTIEYIEREYANEALSLRHAADRLHISSQYLCRVFRSETGDTFVVYLSKVRLQNAMKLLQDTDMKIYEIAVTVGYASQHYFSSAFKKYLGMSPMEYRKNLT